MPLALRKKTRRVENDLAALIADVNELRHAVGQVIGRVGPSSLDGAWKSASHFADQVGDGATSIYNGASSIYRDATRRGGRNLRLINRRISAQPAASVLVAFGVGLLLSHLLSSRRDSSKAPPRSIDPSAASAMRRTIAISLTSILSHMSARRLRA